MTTITNTDLLEIIKNDFTIDELSVDPKTFGETLEDKSLCDEYMTITVGSNIFNISFDLDIELNVVNSGGNGYDDENFDYVDGMELDVTITDVESVETNDTFDLDSDELEKVLETLVIKTIDENF